MNIFKTVKAIRPKRNVFDLSHERKMSMQMGDLVPILCQEVVPGDSFRLNSEIFVRLAPLIAPLMHRINVYTHFFFVPNRIVWDDWEHFITGGPDGQSTAPHPSFMPSTQIIDYFKPGTLVDYFGLPTIPSSTTTILPNNLSISSLPFRAYQKIYNDYYRDQNLMEPVPFSTGTFDNPLSELLTLRKRCWEKDYFTSCLPWAQRGGDVVVPGVADADVVYQHATSQLGQVWRERNTGSIASGMNNVAPITLYGTGESLAQTAVNGNQFIDLDPRGTLKVDGTSGSTINDLRRSIRLQEWLEKNARGGVRYIEQIFSHFGVKSSDSRLQRPEYLGGGKSPVVISEVLQTSQTDINPSNPSPQGNMAGHGISVGNTHRFKKFFEEHGYVIGIMSVLPRTAYQEGIPRHFTKFDKFDYFWPSFAHLGEQAVLNKEVYTMGYLAVQQANEPFGYQSRYAEYKYAPSTVHGDFRDTMAYWHMGRRFDASLIPFNFPALNKDFVTANPRQDVFAVPDPQYHKLYVQIFNDLKAIRPMPVFGTPTI